MKLKPDQGEYRYECEVEDNYDGDTFWVWITKSWDFGFSTIQNCRKRVNVRLKGVDTPELRDSRPEFKAAGYLAKHRAAEWLHAEPVIFLSLDKPDKYGRALGDFQRADGTKLSSVLLMEHLGVVYEGQNKEDVEAAHKINIEELKAKGLIG